MSDEDLYLYLHEHYQHVGKNLICVKQTASGRHKPNNIMGTPRKDGYIVWWVDGKLRLMHQVLWFMKYKRWAKKIDHIDHNRANNSIDNLREVTHGQNLQNCSKSKSNSSGYTGIYWHTKKNKWHVQLMINRRRIHIGYFAELPDAIIARDSAHAKYGFHPNHGT